SLPGTEDLDDVIVLSAYYDSMSVVPALSPGAEQACSMAALLELARVLEAHPLKRRVVFLATAGHGQAMSGMRSFVRRHILPDPDTGAPRLRAAAFVGLDLSSQSQRVGLFYKGHYIDQNEQRLKPWVSHLGKRWLEKAEAACVPLGWTAASRAVDCINKAGGRDWRAYLPGAFAFESELATLAGVVGLTFATANDARFHIDTPLDTVDHVRLPNLADQVKLLACALPNLLNTAGPFVRKPMANYWTRLSARAVEFDFRKDYQPNEPLEGALILIQEPTPKKSLTGVRGEPILLADANGAAPLDGLPEKRAVGAARAKLTLAAFCVDAATGAVTYAPDLGTEGARTYPLEVEMNASDKASTIVCFPAQGLAIFDLTDQRYYIPFDTINVLDAGTNSSPTNYGYVLPRNPKWMSTAETCAVVFAKPQARLRILMGAGPVGKRMLLLNASKDEPLGTGFSVAEEGSTLPLTSLRAVNDLWLLDEKRTADFREHGLESPRVDRLHGAAKVRLGKARTALEQLDYASFLANVRAAWALEARIYPEVVGNANDVVKGLIFYLMLVLPFSFFIERLLVSARTIAGRILGTTGCFVIVFALLGVFHPAFRVAISPLMILLAFIILTLSVLVISLVIRRFEDLMEERRTAAGGVHAADVSRLSATVTAFLLGIGNLRRRPMRTSLTATTLILLTFSVLSLTAVVQYLKETVVPYSGVEARYDGLLLRGRQWQAISVIALDALRNEFGRDDLVVPRAWYYSTDSGAESSVAVTGGPDRKTVYTTAFVGLDPTEKDVLGAAEALIAGGWIERGKAQALLPEPVVKALGLTAEDAIGKPVECFGHTLAIAGVYDPKKMTDVTDLDGEPITPVDYVSMSQRRQEEGAPDPSELEEYIHLSGDKVAIVPYNFLIDVGGSLRSIVVKAQAAKDVSLLLKELMPRTELTLFAGRDGATELFSTRSSSSITGAGTLIVPTLLAALIVFNTMLGSIYERTREIGIFSSIGLAPKHIGALFLAESVVYAVVGTVLGYLLGQAVAQGVHAWDLLPGLQLNYSSTATVLLSIFVMAVVVGSSIYPSVQARRIAAPALEARWSLPEAVDDVMTIELPFTVSGDTALGLNGFLIEYFENHTEGAMSGFAAENVRLDYLGATLEDGLRVAMTAWLAPFDVGVSQEVEVTTALLPDDVFYGITLGLRRLSGDDGSWRRLNRHFTDLVRRQFLIWRILSDDARHAYMERVAAHRENA
ncbi:M28 family peptidase, partial [bacterium]|nr:M28 family peptidase [bacterium]